ncbi:MAG: integrin alpha [Candidatus Nanopelagicales bacterium]
MTRYWVNNCSSAVASRSSCGRDRLLGTGLAVVLGAGVLTGAAATSANAITGPIDLLTQANITINGAAANDRSGWFVAGAGDVNNDGFDDVIIGAPRADNNALTDSGSAYVVYGSATPTTPVDLANLGSAGFRIDGAAANDLNGWSVAGAGDVNSDGFADVIVGAPYADNISRFNSGSSYVVYGSASRATPVDLGNLGSAGFRIDGSGTSDQSGFSVAGAGDVNNDGFDDVIIGTPKADNNSLTDSGSSYVVYGSASRATPVDLSNLGSAGFRIDGAATSDQSGLSVAGAGDVNNDGFADVIVGAPYADNNSRSNSGSSYVVYGSATPTTPVDLGNLGSAGFRIDGAAGDFSGWSVAGARDVNNDGFPDVVIGAPFADNNSRANSGSSYVVYGSATPTTPVDLNNLGSAGFRIDGAAGDYSGFSVAGAGDVNNDGGADVIIGAPSAGNNSRSKSGSSYVVYGEAPAPTPPTPPTPTPDPVAQFPLDGCVTKPLKIPLTGKRQLTKSNCVTNAGQNVKVRVKGKLNRGDVRYYRVIRKNNGRTLIKTFGNPLRLTITWKAAATGDYAAYKTTKRYTTK